MPKHRLLSDIHAFLISHSNRWICGDIFVGKDLEEKFLAASGKLFLFAEFSKRLLNYMMA